MIFDLPPLKNILVDNIVKVWGKNHISPIKNFINWVLFISTLRLNKENRIALTINIRTNTFNQIGKKIIGGHEKINHIIFIPPKIENGNKNNIPLIINLSLSSDIKIVSLPVLLIANKKDIRQE